MNAITDHDQTDPPNASVIVHSSQPLAMPAEAAPVAIPNGCPNLTQALSVARDRCKSASKDKRNEFHKYDYASADEVILTAKQALEGTGLGIIPQMQEMTVVGSGSVAFHALNRTVLLSHSSGEYVPLTVRGWPVIPDRGRPLDKALAAALTGSLAYMLRDLLQMPRGDDADMNTRDDRQHAPQQERQQAPTKQAPERQQRAPDPQEPILTVQDHAKRLEEAETVEELKAEWKSVLANKRLTEKERASLAVLKDDRKEALNSPDGIFAGGKDQQNTTALKG